MITRARALAIADSRQWLRLGHWRRRWPGRPLARGWLSEADGAAFFLSPSGRVDPESELEANIRAFFSAEEAEDESVDEQGPPRHAICRFPARFLFLRRALEVDVERLRIPRCRRFTAFLQEMQPESVTLVFSSYFLNNPASAFGHTFLRIDKADPLAVGERKELLDTGIDFGADVDTQNSFVYAFKGVFGMFPGNFRRLPYYAKVRQYGDFESRDLWEYDLALSPQQVEMLVAHLWELGSTHFDYYYFSENCSYHILGVLAAALPEEDLMERIHTPVIPADTIQAIEQTPGLVAAVQYRPSIRTIFRARLEQLDPDQRTAVARLASHPEHPLPDVWEDTARIAVLDAAADLIDVRHARDLLEGTSPDAAARKQALLERRASIREPSPPLDVPVPERKQPHLGHRSRRLGIGPAVQDDGTPAVAVDLRLSLHDLADPTDGYPELSQIEFLSARFRVSTEEKPVFTLDDAALVRVVSLNPVDRFELLPSWKFSVGGRMVDDAGCNRCFAANALLGGGLSKTWASEAITLFGRIDAQVESGSLDGIAGAPIRAGLGPTGGIRLRPDPRLVFLARGSWLYHPAQRPRGLWQAEAILRWGLRRNLAISGEVIARDHELTGRILAMLYL